MFRQGQDSFEYEKDWYIKSAPYVATYFVGFLHLISLEKRFSPY